MLSLLLAGLLAAVGPARAAEKVAIRAAEHDGFARVVFDWPAPVTFTATVRGRDIRLRFDRPLLAAVRVIPRKLRRYVADAHLSKDRKSIDIVLTGTYAVETFSLGKAVVADFRPAGNAIAMRAAYSDRARAGDSAAPRLPVRVGQHEKYLRLVFDWTKPVDYKVQEIGETVRLRFGRDARIDMAALRSNLPPEFAKAEARTDAGALVLTGGTAYVFANTPALLNTIYQVNAQGQLAPTIAGWVVLLAPLALVFFLSFRIQHMSQSAAQLTFWGYAALVGASLASIFVVYTDASIATTFFVTAATFGTMSLYGYTTKRDLSGFGNFLFMGLIGILIASLVNIWLQSAASTWYPTGQPSQAKKLTPLSIWHVSASPTWHAPEVERSVT